MKLLSLKGLNLYFIFVALLLGGFLYIQLFGMELYQSTKTEHEGNTHSYGSSHHSTHRSHGSYYHK